MSRRCPRTPPPVAAAAATALFATFCAPAWIGAPAAAQGGLERFEEEISITEVEIPVHVIRRGEPVRGLTAEDFEVLDDGEPREIIGFRVIELDRTERAEAVEAEPADRRTAPAAAEGRRILLLLDFVFSSPHKLERALLGAREMVAEQLHPEDRVGVAYLTGGGANLLLGFTANREELDAGLGVVQSLLDRKSEDVESGLRRLAEAQGLADGSSEETGGETGRETGGPTGSGERRTTAAVMAERFGPAAAVAMLGGVEAGPATDQAPGFGTGVQVSDPEFNDGDSSTLMASRVSTPDPFEVGRSMESANETSAVRTLALEIGRLATLLRDVPGQKQMLYLSEGFSASSIETFASGQRALVLRHLETMFEALRRSGWTLHAVDAGGVPDAFSERGFSATPLFYMANETGGFLFENYNRIHQATARLVERTSVTYVLTFHPGDVPADGRLHRLEVRLKDAKRGTRLHHRTGYYAPKPPERRTTLERRLDTVDLLLGEDEVDELGARFMARGLPPEEGLVPVPLVLEIPGASLVSEERPDRARSGRLPLELQAYAVDAGGGVQDLWLRRLDLDLREVGERLARGGIRVLGALAVPPGEYRVRVLARNRLDDRLSLATVPLTVPEDAAGTSLVLGPVAIDRSGDWVELVSLPPGPGGTAGEALAMDAEARAPAVPPVAPAVQAWEGLEFLVAASGAGKLSARVLDGDGRELRPEAGAEVQFIERLAPSEEGSLARHVGVVDTAQLEPGLYRLEVRAAAAAGAPGEAPARTLTFRILG